MAESNSWCPNCQQMVEARPEPDRLVGLLVVGAVIGTYWFTSLVQSTASSIMAAVFAAIIAVVYAIKYNAAPRCPICRTRGVQAQPPSAP